MLLPGVSWHKHRCSERCRLNQRPRKALQSDQVLDQNCARVLCSALETEEWSGDTIGKISIPCGGEPKQTRDVCMVGKVERTAWRESMRHRRHALFDETGAEREP